MSDPAASTRQAAHYDRILADYEAHYYDRHSMAFREVFIYRPLFSGLDLNGLRVADLASGSGHNSLAVKRYFPHATTVGVDISPQACQAYGQKVGGEALVMDLTREPWTGEGFDAVLMIGGLHHCVADLRFTLENIARMLKPGGIFLFAADPNRRYFLQFAREIWYRRDHYFDAESEEALDLGALAAMGAPWFKEQTSRHFGGPAFFLVYNSLIFRIPLWLKPLLSPPLMGLDHVYNLLPGRFWYPTFRATWIRR